MADPKIMTADECRDLAREHVRSANPHTFALAPIYATLAHLLADKRDCAPAQPAERGEAPEHRWDPDDHDEPKQCQRCGVHADNEQASEPCWGGERARPPQPEPAREPAAGGVDAGKRLPVRTEARMRKPLSGPDAQALEGAITLTERERDAARAELERERMRLAAIGTVSWAQNVEHIAGMLPEYDSDALQSVRKLIGDLDAARAELAKLREGVAKALGYEVTSLDFDTIAAAGKLRTRYVALRKDNWRVRATLRTQLAAATAEGERLRGAVRDVVEAHRGLGSAQHTPRHTAATLQTAIDAAAALLAAPGVSERAAGKDGA